MEPQIEVSNGMDGIQKYISNGSPKMGFIVVGPTASSSGGELGQSNLRRGPLAAAPDRRMVVRAGDVAALDLERSELRLLHRWVRVSGRGCGGPRA